MIGCVFSSFHSLLEGTQNTVLWGRGGSVTWGCDSRAHEDVMCEQTTFSLPSHPNVCLPRFSCSNSFPFIELQQSYFLVEARIHVDFWNSSPRQKILAWHLNSSVYCTQNIGHTLSQPQNKIKLVLISMQAGYRKDKSSKKNMGSYCSLKGK